MARQDEIEANRNDVAYEILEEKINNNETLVKNLKDDIRLLREKIELADNRLIKVKNENNALKEALKVLNPTQSSIKKALDHNKDDSGT